MAYYNAFAHATSPFMTVYKQEGSISTKLPNPASLPVGNQSGPSWSPDATYLAMAGTSYPFITIYKRAGDTLTKLAAPADLPPGGAYTTAWSGNGTYLSVIGGTSPYVTVYKRAGDLFTKIANPGPGSIPGGGQGLGWSADSAYMTIGINESPYIHIYKRATDTLTKLSNPAYVPVNTSATVAWSPNGIYMAVGCHSDPNVIIYKRSGDTFTRLTVPTPAAYGAGQSLAWSPDNTYLAIGRSGWGEKPIVMKRSGDTFTVIMLPTVYGGSTRGVSFSPDGLYLSSLTDASPFVKIYSRSGDTFTLLPAPASLPAGSSTNGNAYSINVNAAPFAPTWSASADSKDKDAPLNLDWTFNDPDGDASTAYALQKVVNGGSIQWWTGSAWGATETKIVTTATSLTLSPGWAALNDSVVFKVLGYDAFDLVSPMSAGLVITAAEKVNPSVTLPTASQVYNEGTIAPEWVCTSQSKYTLRLLSGADVQLWTSEQVASTAARTRSVDYSLVNDTTYKVELTTVAVSGVTSDAQTVTFSTSFTSPQTPTLTLTADAPVVSAVTITIAQGTPTATAVTRNELYRREAAVGGPGTRLIGTVVPNGTVVSYTQRAGTYYEYKVVAIGGNLTVASSLWT
jgi:hypothetical protein